MKFASVALQAFACVILMQVASAQTQAPRLHGDILFPPVPQPYIRDRGISAQVPQEAVKPLTIQNLTSSGPAINLITAQTNVIKALSSRIDELEARVRQLEAASKVGSQK